MVNLLLIALKKLRDDQENENGLSISDICNSVTEY